MLRENNFPPRRAKKPWTQSGQVELHRERRSEFTLLPPFSSSISIWRSMPFLPICLLSLGCVNYRSVSALAKHLWAAQTERLPPSTRNSCGWPRLGSTSLSRAAMLGRIPMPPDTVPLGRPKGNMNLLPRFGFASAALVSSCPLAEAFPKNRDGAAVEEVRVSFSQDNSGRPGTGYLPAQSGSRPPCAGSPVLDEGAFAVLMERQIRLA